MQKLIAILVALSLGVSGCATASVRRSTSQPTVPAAAAADPGVMADYAQHIAVGSRVRVRLADGRTVRGTLMRADATTLLVSPATRVPEPPVSLPTDAVRGIELDRSTNVVKVIAIGAAAGAAATLGVLFLLFAMVGD
jgi:hypothetical protein